MLYSSPVTQHRAQRNDGNNTVIFFCYSVNNAYFFFFALTSLLITFHPNISHDAHAIFLLFLLSFLLGIALSGFSVFWDFRALFFFRFMLPDFFFCLQTFGFITFLHFFRDNLLPFRFFFCWVHLIVEKEEIWFQFFTCFFRLLMLSGPHITRMVDIARISSAMRKMAGRYQSWACCRMYDAWLDASPATRHTGHT